MRKKKDQVELKIQLSRNDEGQLVLKGEDLLRAIQVWIHHANQNTPGAAATLTLMAFRATMGLALVAKRNPAALQAHAKNFCYWPVMFGHHPSVRKCADALIKKIKLSKRYALDPFMPDAKETPAKAITWHLIAWVNQIRRTDCILPNEKAPTGFLVAIRRLPPINQATDEWFRVIRGLIDYATNDHPERQVTLRLLGVGKETHKQHDYPLGTKTAEANVRAEIYAKIRAALKGISKKQHAEWAADVLCCEDLDSFAVQMFHIFPHIPPPALRGVLLRALDAKSRREKSS